MPRTLRIEYEGAICHVLNRGDRREPIFRDDADRKRFLETLGEACVKTDWQIHALCLMGNYSHCEAKGGFITYGLPLSEISRRLRAAAPDVVATSALF